MTRVFATATVEIEIPFHDIDIMKIAWHGHYAKYLEIARCAMLETIDYNILQMQASGYAWPVIEMNTRYAAPLRFQQKVQVEAKLVEVENRMKINYRIFDLETGKRLSKAYTIQVAVSMESGEMLFASPRALLDKLPA
jgi:acyl-CoA thioester hydrolase